MKKNWFSLTAVAAADGGQKTASVSIHDVIGLWGVSVKDFARELRDLGEVARIDLSLHSPGGSVTDGWAIYNILKAHPAPVHAKVEGLAASMASVILMAADRVEIPANAYVMIHNPSMGGYEANDLRELAAEINDELIPAADLLDKMRGNIIDVYSARTGGEAEDIGRLMDNETWMDGAEAVALGFADVLLEDVKAAALATDWADILSNIPAGAEVAKGKSKRAGIIARLLGTDEPVGAADLNDEITALRTQVETARTDHAAIVAALDTANAARVAAEAAAATAALDLTTAQARVAELTAAMADFDTRLASGITARLQELGVPEGSLPPGADGDLGDEETIEGLTKELAAENDPEKRFTIADRISALRKKSRV